MSVRTTADEHLDCARETLGTAIKELAEVVINQCPGWDDFTPTAKDATAEALVQLLNVRDHVMP